MHKVDDSFLPKMVKKVLFAYARMREDHISFQEAALLVLSE